MTAPNAKRLLEAEAEATLKQIDAAALYRDGISITAIALRANIGVATTKRWSSLLNNAAKGGRIAHA
jgi:transposase